MSINMHNGLWRGLLLLWVFALGACKDAPPEGPAAPGPYSLCSYKSNLGASGYGSARLSYPCDSEAEQLPAVTLTGGYTNIKEQMYWLADHLTRHGYIVLTVTPNNVFGGVSFWESAHQSAFDQLHEENQREESPVFGRVDTERIALAGYSNGGAGAIRVANREGARVKSVVGMAPYFPQFGTPEFPGLMANTLTLVGTLDTTAFPFVLESAFEALPDTAQHAFVEFRWVSHFDWIALGRYHNKFKLLILSWLELTLNNNPQYESYLYGEQHQQHLDMGWYRDYTWRGPVMISNTMH
ncbi:MAG: alpha/beta hydrolase [Ketobacteraceae bacterium]|nr:alpha/beta hydrolase [Ketobacteraceae bacterium]